MQLCISLNINIWIDYPIQGLNEHSILTSIFISMNCLIVEL